VLKIGWIKKCKVCEKEINPQELSNHETCLKYTAIVRYEKTD